MMSLALFLAIALQLLTQLQGWKVYPCHNISLTLTATMMSASSVLSPNTSAARGRLNIQKVGPLAGGWSTAFNNLNQWLRVDLGQLSWITGIRTQGRQDKAEWVEEYQLYSAVQNLAQLHPYRNANNVVVFTGNTDQNSIVAHLLSKPYIIARYVQVRPRKWHNHISMRIGLDGCPQSQGYVHVDCSSRYMAIYIHSSLLVGLQPQDLHLTSPTCTGQAYRLGTQIYYKLESTLDGCNTTCTTTTNYITYHNRVTETNMRKGQVISRLRRVMVPFTCSYRSTDTKTSIGIQPNISVLYVSEHGMGMFPCSLDLYKSANYSVKVIGPGPIRVKLNQRMYFQLTLTTGDVHLWIRADKCYGNPSSNRLVQPQYVLINNGCAVDKTVILYSRGTDGRIQRFSYLTFVIFKQHRFLFIHCRVRVCKGRAGFCGKSCATPGKRGLQRDKPSDSIKLFEHHASYGPIVMMHGAVTDYKYTNT